MTSAGEPALRVDGAGGYIDCIDVFRSRRLNAQRTRLRLTILTIPIAAALLLRDSRRDPRGNGAPPFPRTSYQ